MKLLRPLALLVAFGAFAIPAIAFAQSYPNRPASVAYVKVMKARIGTLWANYAKQSPQSVSPGVVKISFRINPDGTIQNIRVDSNTSNQFLADISVRAIKNAKLPPPPQAVLREEGRDWIEVRNMNFNAP